MSRIPLTRLAHQRVAEVVHPGERVVDATVGNGHDTLFLARQVAPGGQVTGFDIQAQALGQARARLRDAGLEDQATLLLCGHEDMQERLPADWRGEVAAVMFNLGYLPGGDRSVLTRPDTTLTALQQAIALLRRGGVLSVMLYRGHPGASPEVTAVEDWIAGLAENFRVTRHESPGPCLYLVQRTD